MSDLLSPGEIARLAVLRTYDVVDARKTATIDNAAAIAARVAGKQAGFVALVDATTVIYKGTFGFEANGLPKPETHHREGCFANQVVTQKQRLIVPDASADIRFRSYAEVVTAGIRFFAGVPLINNEGFAVGLIGVCGTAPGLLDAMQIDTLERVAENTMIALELRKTLHHARHMALTDTLTGIANRHAFFEATKQVFDTRQDIDYSLLYLDLDGFKRLNDTLGHSAGDLALRVVANRISANARNGDVVARLGGDEFAVLLANNVAGAAIGERIKDDVAAHMEARGFGVTVSVGVLTFMVTPSCVSDALAASDEMMYEAKRRGKNRVIHSIYSGPCQRTPREGSVGALPDGGRNGASPYPLSDERLATNRIQASDLQPPV